MQVSQTSTRFIVLGIALAGFSAVAFATTDSGAWGRNRLNQTIHVAGQISTYKNTAQGRRTDEIISAVPLKAECRWVDLTPTTAARALDCTAGTASPLAGAYYKIRFSKTHRNECRRGATIYECKQGCEPARVPKVFVEEPNEC